MDLSHLRLILISVEKSELSSTGGFIWGVPYFGTNYYTPSQPLSAQETILGGHAISSKSQKKGFKILKNKPLGTSTFESLSSAFTHFFISQATF